MKNIIMLFCLALIAGACSPDQADPKPITPTIPTTPSTTDTLMGTFVVVKESVIGNVKLYTDNDSKVLMFDETFMANGPDLKVYLSVDANASDYKSLGSLKSGSGAQTYTIPATIDLNVYGKYVIVYCQKYSVLFGNAELK